MFRRLDTKCITKIKGLIFILFVTLISCNNESISDEIDKKYDLQWNDYGYGKGLDWRKEDDFRKLESGIYDQKEIILSYAVESGVDFGKINNCKDLLYLAIDTVSDITELKKLKFENFQNLRRLVILRGYLTNELLHEITKCKSLRHLVVQGSGEDIIVPKEIANLTKLKGIRFSGINFKAIDRHFRLLKIEDLVLVGCSFNGYESSFFGLRELKVLRFYECALTKVPEEVKKMSGLKTLEFHGGQKLDLSALSGCDSLELLCLYHLPDNPILDLENTNLKRLVIRSTNLYSLPKLPQTLEWLVINNCEIDNYEFIGTVPDSLNNITIIRSLFKSFPENWKVLKKVELLYIYDCGLEELPEWIGEWPIKDLNLYNHKLQRIPDSFSKLPLEKFYLGSVEGVENNDVIYKLKSNVVAFVFNETRRGEKLRTYDPEIYPFVKIYSPWKASCYSPTVGDVNH